MDLQNLFEVNSGLDFHILKEKDLLDRDLFEERLLGFQTKIGRLADLRAGWQYWSNNIIFGEKAPFESYKPNEEVLNTYVDALNFLISLTSDVGISPSSIEICEDLTGDNLAESFNKMFAYTSVLYAFLDEGVPGTISHDDLIGTINDLFNCFAGIGELWLYLDWDIDIEPHFLERNNTYHEKYNFVG